MFHLLNIEMHYVERLKVERMNVEIPNIEWQNVEPQNVKLLDVERLNVAYYWMSKITSIFLYTVYIIYIFTEVKNILTIYETFKLIIILP
jgi:hypothetical protein